LPPAINNLFDERDPRGNFPPGVEIQSLFVGDAHVGIPGPNGKPAESLIRFDWLAHAINEINPKRIIFLGDLADMHCLYSHTVKENYNPDFSLKNDSKLPSDTTIHNLYDAEVEQVRKALGMLGLSHQDREIYLTLGNHEKRIVKCLEYFSEGCWPGLNPWSTDQLYAGYSGFSIQCVNYKQPLTIPPLQFAHQPWSHFSKQYTKQNTRNEYIHIHGHTHYLKTGINKKGNTIISVGCYLEQHPEYYRDQENFWAGVVAVDDKGHFWSLPIETMKARYGSSTTTTDSPLILPKATWAGETQPALIAVAACPPQPYR